MILFFHAGERSLGVARPTDATILAMADIYDFCQFMHWMCWVTEVLIMSLLGWVAILIMYTVLLGAHSET